MTTIASPSEVCRPGTAAGGKFLTFRLDRVEYGLAVLRVREIIGMHEITAVPQMPDFVKGVVNLRGTLIPVIDLRLKFGLAETERTEHTCIIVVEVGRAVGIIVDTVSDVLEITAENIEPPPTLGNSSDTSFLLGMGKVGDAVKLLLDVDRLLSCDGLARLDDLRRFVPGAGMDKLRSD